MDTKHSNSNKKPKFDPFVKQQKNLLSMATWAQHLTHFYGTLTPPPHLPNGVTWLHPQQSGEVMQLAATFFKKYFNDEGPRTLLLGINPGRFGAGATGINFTAPRQLTEYCNIEHHLKPQSELSAEFIYEVIGAYGGLERFYKRFFIGSVCPLGFVQGGKNINYYDDKALLQTVEPFIINNLQKLLGFAVRRQVCICIGGEKNFKYLSKLNNQHRFFETIIPVAHPRFILQYRRKEKQAFVDSYLQALEAAEG